MLETPEAVRKTHLSDLAVELTRRGIGWEITAVEPYQPESSYYDPTGYLIGAEGDEILSIRLKLSGSASVMQVVTVKHFQPAGASIYGSDYSLTTEDGQLYYELTVLEHRPNHAWTNPVHRARSQTAEGMADSIIELRDYSEKYKVPVALPAAAKEAARLKAIAESKLSNEYVVERHVDSFFVGNMPKNEQDILQEDLKHLSDAALLWHFPRNDKGQFERGQHIMLATYPPSLAGKYLSRAVWLAVEGPVKVADRILILGMRNTTGENFEHQWWQERWMWDTRARRGDLHQTWEINDKAKAVRCYELLTKGKVVEALEMYDIELEPQLQSLAEGKPVDFEQKDYTKIWVPRLIENFMRSAPWRFALLLAREKQCREAWVKQKASRKYESKPISLFGLGGVQKPERPQVFLSSKGGGKMQLTLEWSGTQITAPYCDWRRPIDYDLLQNGLIKESDIP